MRMYNEYVPEFLGMLDWQLLHPKMTPDHLGLIPSLLSSLDPRPAKEQIHENYEHGGGWTPNVVKFTLDDEGLHYPGDAVMIPLAEAKLRDETIRFYTHAWTAIIQPDGSYEVSRLD